MAEKSQLNLTGRKEAMEPFGLRLPKADAIILRRTARRERCRGADLLRTAWSEYVTNHNLDKKVV